MEIKLDDKWFLTSDERNYIIAQKRSRGKRTVWLNASYYGTLEGALIGYFDQALRTAESVNDLQQLKQCVETLKNNIVTVLGILREGLQTSAKGVQARDFSK